MTKVLVLSRGALCYLLRFSFSFLLYKLQRKNRFDHGCKTQKQDARFVYHCVPLALPLCLVDPVSIASGIPPTYIYKLIGGFAFSH